MRSSAAPLGAICCGLLLLTACPQLLDDDFTWNKEPLSQAGTTWSGTAGTHGLAGNTTGGSPIAGNGGSADNSAGSSSGGSSAGGSAGSMQEPDAGPAQADAAPPFPLCEGEFDTPVPVSISGVSGSLYGAWPFGERLFFSVLDDDEEDLFVATLLGANSYGNTLLLGNVNTDSAEGSPHVTAEGTQLFFFSDRAGGGGGGRDLWHATRTSPGQDFGAPSPVANVSSSSLEGSPRLSSDGLRLRFVSTRSGSSDLWQAQRATPNDPFGAPSALSELNTNDREEGAAFSTDDLTVYFSSDRTTPSMDVWRAIRSSTSEPFGAPERVPSLSSSSDDVDLALRPDGMEIFFSSNRGGSMAVWHAYWICD